MERERECVYMGYREGIKRVRKCECNREEKLCERERDVKMKKIKECVKL
jgi:hypothetical protein